MTETIKPPCEDRMRHVGINKGIYVRLGYSTEIKVATLTRTYARAILCVTHVCHWMWYALPLCIAILIAMVAHMCTIF